ncbi:glyoxalase superfamily protein [Bradyrhizobium sp. WSM471]|uniref:glyoxalase superfamily protein n=1 Tax=Bradyrhizobium sp. WSM471 TaxID=319017 RepID=UPI00024D2095|nr:MULTISPECIES: glyoxalase superfamily protein [Bradyrhizobium]EHR01252.1 hypothetical protein Bra471DRAFT_01954 [Bradyrhizobium sp. WSM471]UFW43316.1 hypothetical protein BcanWSM471_09620 [Bradyrhizobium canariense]
MIVTMTEECMRGMAKRLRKVLSGLGVELKHTVCLELAAKLCGFENWRHFCLRNPDEPLILLDDEVSDDEFATRDAFQMAALQAADLDAVARELLDRANPTGSWARQSEEAVTEYVGGNDPS